MSVDEDPKLPVLSLMGECLLAVQLAEKVLATAVGSVLDHPDLRLLEQSESERRQTLGNFLKKLKRRVKVERAVKDKLYHFLQMGGRTYGYSVCGPAERTRRPAAGFRAINKAEAEIVLPIFEEYVAGKTPREIAHGLNRDRIQAPRDKRWNASTINGNSRRSNGILLNEMYTGRISGTRLRWPRIRQLEDG